MATACYREALAGKRETLGDRHPSTLTSIYNLADLLEGVGKVAEAVPLFREELEGCAARYGDAHKETTGSAKRLVGLLRREGRAAEAADLEARFGS